MIYVAGAGGYIGRTLLEYLMEREYEVRGIMRGSVLPMGFTHRDVVVNCACRGWKDGDEDPLDVVESNVLLPLELEKRRNGAVSIHLSSGLELLQPEHLYAATKGVASKMLHERAHVLYLYTIWGGRHVQMNRFMSSMMKACASGEPYTIETPYHTRDFVHVNRLMAVIEALLDDRNYRTLHVGSGRPVAMVDAYRTLERVTGKKFENVTVNASDRTSFLYYSPQKLLPDTMALDMAIEWKALACQS